MISVVLGELLECQRYLMSDPKRIPKLIFDLMKDTTMVVSIDYIYFLVYCAKYYHRQL